MSTPLINISKGLASVPWDPDEWHGEVRVYREALHAVPHPRLPELVLHVRGFNLNGGVSYGGVGEGDDAEQMLQILCCFPEDRCSDLKKCIDRCPCKITWSYVS